MKIYEKICDICRREYRDLQMRECKHPAVNRRYGKNVCYSCCRKCKFNKDEATGSSCAYEVDK